MGTPRKLNQEQEREVALAYLCKVPIDAIKERYAVSEATITNNIVKRYSREWNDPLVEFYRQTPISERERNAAHMYVSFETYQFHNVNTTNLVDEKKDRATLDLIVESVIEPQVTRVIRETALEQYATPSSYGKLLDSIFGTPLTPESLVYRLVHKRLPQFLSDRKQFSWNVFFNNVKDEIVSRIRMGDLNFSAKKIEEVEKVLETLEEREKDVLKRRYGLGYDNTQTIEEVGKFHKITREKVRRVESKAIRKLQHPVRENRLSFLVGFVSDEDIDKRYKQLEREELKNELREEIISEYLGQADKNRQKPITEFELAVRTRNCMAKMEIKTLGDLATKTEDELLSYKNFGQTSLEEVKEILASQGLRLASGDLKFKKV